MRGTFATRGGLAGLGVTAAAAAIAVAAGIPAASAAKLAVAKPAVATHALAVAASSAPTAAVAPAAPAAYTPPKRTLREGMKGADVKALQQRLAALKYYPGAADGNFGSNTLEAVWAFQEVNRLTVDGVIGSATKKALAHPRTYQAKYPGQAATRVEINLGMGVLVFFKNHQIALISHVSTGGHYYYTCGGGSGTCYAQTQTGKFYAQYFVNGWDPGPLGPMYNPVFFNLPAGQAIHGEYNAEVPVKPVSHGCVRIPYDIAQWFHNDLVMTTSHHKGTEILVYNQW